MPQDYSIGTLAQCTGTKVQTIRFYEQRGLLPAPPRTEGGQRRYSEDHLRRLAFIRHGRDLGFSLEMIGELMELSEHPEAICKDADKIAAAHLSEVEEKIRRLEMLRTELTRMLDHSCEGRIGECRVIETLSADTPMPAPKQSR
ncbi:MULTISPECIES: MerR family transcriptional regulator [Pseudovibrio]|uniref:MerR family transcriptional regulator n=1 Tax=Stappiaceae TaxID=2821832 RepID=UPI002365FFA6|nr:MULTISPECIES: helix-turn-helix domain-containing protein [Pseudovibrio]MDD7911307.1 helix-turn-helix domain-containing protein [Pseudovibrio exalbescens]MDX5593006.1 helix-turn-helix domain-containing protein [Pseudovibrio sp. SPO723]